MPKVAPNSVLLSALEAVIQSAGGNESEAARRLGTTRLVVNRVRKAKGGATPATRDELWKMFEQLDHGGENPNSNDTNDTETIQIVRDVPGVALQVLRYMTGIIERDIGSEGQAHAH